MSRDALKTLYHPFAAGLLDLPGEGQRFLFLNAEAGQRLPEGFSAGIEAVQPLRPLYRALEAARAQVTPTVAGEGYDGALVLCGKHKGANENNIAEALKRVRAGGTIVIAGGKEDGIQSLRKRLSVPVSEWDERLSSFQAARQVKGTARQRSGELDSAAAAVILQAVIESRRKPLA